MGRITPIIRVGFLFLFGAASVITATACNEHSVAMVDQNIVVQEEIEIAGGSANKLDILWVIDNSGSMCRNQGILRRGIQGFVDTLEDVHLDFNIGVTTTHMNAQYPHPQEFVARPGRLQSTPQPIPGFDTACHSAVDEQAEPIPDDITPVLESIEAAVNCTAEPSDWTHLLTPSQEELRCVLNEELSCSLTQAERNALNIEDYFPPFDAYREIPLFLSSEDPRYRQENGAINVERLASDLECMSMVGTRGDGFEQGLAALNLAVSPEMTAEGAPNEGFIRDDANFAFIVVSDENDCSHDGTIARTACDSDQCTVEENKPDGGALLKVSDLRNELMLNLALSKGLIDASESPSAATLESLIGDDIYAASIHGRYDRHLDLTVEQCNEAQSRFQLPPACISTQGKSWSGHRYSEFITGFSNFYPAPPDLALDPNRQIEMNEIDGLICSEFSDVLEEIAKELSETTRGCVGGVFSCSGPDDSSCPSNAATGEPGQCVRYPAYSSDDGAQFYCDSGIEVRLKLADGEDDLSRLESTGYCVEGTIGTGEFPRSCVVDDAHFNWGSCGNNIGPFMEIEWSDDQWRQILDGLDVSARYARK